MSRLELAVRSSGRAGAVYTAEETLSRPLGQGKFPSARGIT